MTSQYDFGSVSGLDALVRKLEYLSESSANKVLTSMIRAQLNVIAKQMRKDVSPRVKDGRRAIKSRFKHNRKKGWVTAKVGFHVGPKRPKVKEVTRKRGRGVGISAQNIHWWVAGTALRSTKRMNPNVSRGTMPAMQRGLAHRAMVTSRTQQIVAMRQKGSIQLKKELGKVRAVK